ncbi:MAG TPA: ABC transporter substrate-binding protein [Candidatus Limnocylindrales bacterium]
MDDQEKRAGLLSGGQVSRREILKKGLVGAAGLTVLPAVLAACSTSTASATTAMSTEAPSTGGAAGTPTTAPITGKVTIGSNNSDAVPKKALSDAVDAFKAANSGVTVSINTVDHSTFQNNISSYLAATPEDVITWFSGYRMRAFVDQGLFTAIDDVWAGSIGSLYTDAVKTACTANDGKKYMVPFDTYAWTVYYVPSLWKDKGYTVPTTLDELKTLATKMQKDGIVPIGLGDKDGWPAMGHFDIINLRENGYQFHVDLMAGKKKWTDAGVVQVFNVWKGLLPYYQSGAAGRLWQDAAAGLVAKTTGMMLQPQVVQTFQAAGAANLADLDFFPWPHHGTTWDAEEALDAPIDGYMLTANSSTAAADAAGAKGLLTFLGQGTTQGIYAKADTSLIAVANNADQSGYTPLQKKQVTTLAAAKKLTQFMDRDTNPGFSGANGMQGFLIDFLSSPNQDLTAFLTKIQTFWDSLGA